MRLQASKNKLALLGLFGTAVFAPLLLGGPLTNKGTQPGLANPLLPPGNCSSCHANYDAVTNIEPWNSWAGTMMAQASRDPIFWAALDVANNDYPGAGDFCLRCHVPAGWLAGRSEPPGGTNDGCGLVGKLDENSASTDFQGVTCHLCHRLHENPSPPVGESSVYYENGQYWVDDVDCAGSTQPCRRGPYSYPLDGNPPPGGAGGHPWTYSAYHESGNLCGNCHNVTNPVKNLIVNGVDTGVRFPVERTHREWQQSAFPSAGTNCQSCHMPDATANPSHACQQLTNDHSGDMPIHRFAGGNAWIPDVLRQEYPSLGLHNELVATRDAALDMLQNQSATVELTVAGQVVAGQDLEVEVKVTNLTGHKLPTGYPEGRRMWLTVEARDGLNSLIWESGAYDPLTAELTHDAAVKIYQIEAGVWNHNGTSTCDITDGVGNPMFHFILNDCIVSDNRIPPLGFTGMNNLETRPVNYTYPETAHGSGILVNYDITDYSIPVPPGTPSPVTVTATLRYQTSSKDYVEFLLDQAIEHDFPDDCIERTSGFPASSRGELLHTMWSNYGKSAPVAMGSDTGAAVVLAASPGEASGGSNDMLVTDYDRTTGEIEIAYDPACAAADHTVYIGSLARVSELEFPTKVCALGTSGQASFTTGGASYFWVIVGNDGLYEGSYGTNHAGVERPEDTASSSCNQPQDLARRCDP